MYTWKRYSMFLVYIVVQGKTLVWDQNNVPMWCCQFFLTFPISSPGDISHICLLHLRLRAVFLPEDPPWSPGGGPHVGDLQRVVRELHSDAGVQTLAWQWAASRGLLLYWAGLQRVVYYWAVSAVCGKYVLLCCVVVVIFVVLVLLVILVV